MYLLGEMCCLLGLVVQHAFVVLLQPVAGCCSLAMLAPQYIVLLFCDCQISITPTATLWRRAVVALSLGCCGLGPVGCWGPQIWYVLTSTRTEYCCAFFRIESPCCRAGGKKCGACSARCGEHECCWHPLLLLLGSAAVSVTAMRILHHCKCGDRVSAFSYLTTCHYCMACLAAVSY
jgi:hypothetical protein